MRFSWIFLLVISFEIFAETAWEVTPAKGFNVQIVLPTSKLRLKDTLEIKLSLKYPKGYHIDSETLLANLLSHSILKEQPFDLISVEEQKTEHEGLYNHSLVFTLQPQKTGTFPVSFFSIMFSPDEGSSEPTIKSFSNIFDVEISGEEPLSMELKESSLLSFSPTLPIEISPSNYQKLIASSSLEELEAKRNEQILSERSFPWFGLLFVPLILFILFLTRQAPIPLYYHKEITPEEAREQALAAIRKLERKRIRRDQFYMQLENILRQYLQQRYKIHASTQTTQELIKELLLHPSMHEKTRGYLKTFLERAEEVKFGGDLPSQESCQQAQQIVESVLVTPT